MDIASLANVHSASAVDFEYISLFMGEMGSIASPTFKLNLSFPFTFIVDKSIIYWFFAVIIFKCINQKLNIVCNAFCEVFSYFYYNPPHFYYVQTAFPIKRQYSVSPHPFYTPSHIIIEYLPSYDSPIKWLHLYSLNQLKDFEYLQRHFHPSHS